MLKKNVKHWRSRAFPGERRCKQTKTHRQHSRNTDLSPSDTRLTSTLPNSSFKYLLAIIVHLAQISCRAASGSLFAAPTGPQRQIDPALRRARKDTGLRPGDNFTGAPPLSCDPQPDGPPGFWVSAVVRTPTPTLRTQDHSSLRLAPVVIVMWRHLQLVCVMWGEKLEQPGTSRSRVENSSRKEKESGD